jgi:hypothetical protein
MLKVIPWRIAMLPFSRAQFLAVFAEYNAGVWPAQWLAYAIGVAMLLMLLRRAPARQPVIAAGLALMWGWSGIAYHWLHFAAINQAALAFGALFVLQAGLLVYAAARGRLTFGLPRDAAAMLGWSLVAYATVLYPLVGLWAGDRYPEIPLFGITPCPVTIFTFGLLLLTTSPVPRWLLVIPFIWSLIGGSATLLLGVPQDWPLLFSGVATVSLLVFLDRHGSPALARAS